MGRGSLLNSGVSGLFPGNSFGVTVDAFYEVDVVVAVRVLEGGVHFLDVEAAIRKSRMTGTAGGASLHSVFPVARHATESFMYADGSAIVAGADLRCGEWGVALIAKGLPLVWAALDVAFPIKHLGDGQFRHGYLTEFAAIEEPDRRPVQLFLRTGNRLSVILMFLQRQTLVMNLMAA